MPGQPSPPTRRPRLLMQWLEGRDGDASKWAGVYRMFRHRIVHGHWAAGQRLPATRGLAKDLGLSRDSVERAYGALEAEGLICRRHGSGTFVAGLGAPQIAHSAGAPDPSPAAPSLSRAAAAVLRDGACTESPDRRAFDAGAPDLKAFPQDTWRRLLARAVGGAATPLMDFGDPMGLAPLRCAIAEHLRAFRNVRCAAGQVMVLTSSQQALDLAARTLLDPGQPTAVEDPGYPGARAALAASGARIVPLPVTAQGVDVDALEQLQVPPRLIVLTPSHQYPTGATLSLDRRRRVLQWAHAHGAWVVEDDYDGEFHYDRSGVSALHGLDANGRVLYVGTFTKTMFPSLRLAFLVLPERLIPAFKAVRNALDGHTSQVTQAAMSEFMQEGHFAAHVRGMRRLYKARRDLLLEHLEGLRDVLEWPDHTHGLKLPVWPRDPSRCDAVQARAERLGLRLPSMDASYFDPRGRRPGWLLGFAGLSNSQIRVGALSLAQALRAGGRHESSAAQWSGRVAASGTGAAGGAA